MVKVIEVVALLFVLAIVAAIPLLISQASATSASPSVAASSSTIPLVNGVQEIKLHASTSGYSISAFTVKKGVPVRILFSADQYAGCGKQLLIPDFGIRQLVQDNEEVPVEFTPNKEGAFPFRCSMNMYRGTMTVTA